MAFWPRLNFCTAFSTNALSICHAIGQEIERIERSHRYVIAPHEPFSDDETRRIARSLHDRMTECRYMTPRSPTSPRRKKKGGPRREKSTFSPKDATHWKRPIVKWVSPSTNGIWITSKRIRITTRSSKRSEISQLAIISRWTNNRISQNKCIVIIRKRLLEWRGIC